MFSSNTGEEIKSVICNVLNVSAVFNHGNYLGAPSLIGKKKADIFDFVKEKAWKRFQAWRNKFLSKAGKEVLLKSVIQSISSYVMSVFLLPQLTCDDLEKMMNSFWWGNGGNYKIGVQWKKWGRLFVGKSKGGLGFERIHYFNVAILTKQS